MVDRVEQTRRGSSQVKKSTIYPYAAIEHRVLDSAAYADLTYSARSLLMQFARQLSKDNNGHLQATFSYLQRFGFDSDRTITRAVRELISHGFVCITRSGGFHQGPSKYAVTWLPIKRRQGLFLDGFLSCAWRDWKPEENKTPPSKLRTYSRKNGGLTTPATDKFTAYTPAKFTDIELMPVGVVIRTDNWIWKRPRSPALRQSYRPIGRQTSTNQGDRNGTA